MAASSIPPNAGAIGTLLRAQSAGTVTQLANRQVAQNSIATKAAGGARPSSVLAAKNVSGPSKDLPRGSIVDILA
ncbi:MAG TPA: hypothetical protein VMV79_02960 [Alphaproteobacteria bacterium]|nr:hypothetical protein [Alphaproteobacteria bacterium]